MNVIQGESTNKVCDMDAINNSQICRLCGTPKLSSSCIGVFSELGENQSLRCKIKAYVEVLILKNDNLPKQVCISCFDKLNSFCDFKKQCQDTQVNLAYYHNSKSAELTTYNCLGNKNEDKIKEGNKKEEKDNNCNVGFNNETCTGEDLIFNLSKIDLNDVALEEEVEQICEPVELVLSMSPQEAEILKAEDKSEANQSEMCTAHLGTSQSDELVKHKMPTNILILNASSLSDDTKPLPEIKLLSVMNLMTSQSEVADNVPVLKKCSKGGRSFHKTSISRLLIPSLKSKLNDDSCKLPPRIKKSRKRRKGMNPLTDNYIRKRRMECETTVAEYIEKVSSEEYRCKVCSQTFRWNYQCEYHVRSHTGERPFVCKVCEKGFAANNYLTKHMRVHSGHYLFVCEVCGKGFKREYLLKEHVNIHKGETPYRCEVCDRGFNHKISLRYHRITHNTGKDFVCDVCGKAFSQKVHLRNHRIRHEDKKQHNCGLCNKSYVRTSELKIHMKSHVQNKPYSCEPCKMFFKTIRGLKHHHTRFHQTTSKPSWDNLWGKN